MRRVAASKVYFEGGDFKTNHVIELSEGIVTGHYPLECELPMTEWLGGTIIVRKDKKAYHLPAVLSPSELRAYDSCCDGHIQRL